MSGRTEISINTKVMRQAARTIENQLSIVSSCFTSIKDDLKSLRNGDWEGDSANAYIEAMNKLCGDGSGTDGLTSGGIVQILKSYADSLNNTAAAFERNEQKQEDKIQALNAKIFDI